MGDTKIKYDHGGPGKHRTLKAGQSRHIPGQTRKSGKLKHSSVSKRNMRGKSREWHV